MIDLMNEKRIGLREAAKLTPSYREGKPTHVSTIHRCDRQWYPPL